MESFLQAGIGQCTLSAQVWLQDVARNCLVPREDEAKFRAVFLDDFLQHLPEKV